MSRPFGNRGLLLEIYHTEIQDACLLQRSLQVHRRLRGIPERPFGEAFWHCLLRASPKKLHTSPFIGSTQQPCQSGGVSLVVLVAFDNHGTAFFPWNARKGKSQHPATGRKEQTNSDMLMSTKRPLVRLTRSSCCHPLCDETMGPLWALLFWMKFVYKGITLLLLCTENITIAVQNSKP